MQLKIKWGGGTLIEGYFKTNNGKGLYCKVLETRDKYEIWKQKGYKLQSLEAGFLPNLQNFAFTR